MTLRERHTIVSDLLNRSGFSQGRFSGVAPHFSFTRLRGDQVYELIRCNFAGEQLEAAICRVGASVTQIVELKGLSENELFLDIAENRERGWTIVEDTQKFRMWAELVASTAVERAGSFADRTAEELLKRTASTRREAERYFVELTRMGSKAEALQCLLEQSSEAEIRLSQRLLKWPGVIQIPQSELVYKLACLAIVKMVQREKLPNPAEISEMPLQNTQLMWEIQLLADKLLGYDLGSK